MKNIVVFLAFILATSFVSAQDLSTTLIIAPSTACGHTNAETVTIQVFNPGATTVYAPYSIGYSVNGIHIAPEAVAAKDSVQPFSFITLSFATSVDMSTPGVYTFQAYTIVPLDINTANDTATKVVSSDANTIAGAAALDDTVCTGNNGDTIRLSGQFGNVTGWVRTNSGGSTILAVTDTFIDYMNLTETTSYAAIVRNGSCPFDTSTPATITVDSLSIAGTINGPVSECIGNSGALTLTGSKGDVLDWETSTSLAGPWTSASNTTTTFNYVNIQKTSDTLFRAIVQLGVCPADTTDPVKTLLLDNPSVGGTVAQTVGNDTVCTGTNSGTLEVSGHVGAVVEWQSSTGGPFVSEGGGGSNTFSFTNITQTTTYRALIQNGACPSIPSATFTITVDALSVGGTISNDATVCIGSNFGTLNLSGHVGNVINWDSSIVSGAGPFSVITNTTTTQNYSNLNVTTFYRAIVKNGVCPSVPSGVATITVNSLSDGGNITPGGPTTVCSGANTDMLTVAGINGTIQQWEQSTNGGATFTTTGVSTNTFTYLNLTTTTLYRVAVQNGACPVAYSDTITITVLPASIAGTINGPASVCAGSPAALNLTGESGTIVKWRVSTNGGASYSDVGASAGMTTINPTVSVNSLFVAIVQAGACTPDTTAPFAVNADLATAGGAVTANDTICSGATASVSLAGETGTVVRWESSTDGGANWVDEGNAGLTTFNSGALTDTTLFRAIVQNSTCPIDSSIPAEIVVIPPPIGGIASVAAPNDTVCEGTHSIAVSLTGAFGTILRWESSTGGPFVDEGVNGNPQAFTKNFTATTTFRAVIENGTGCPTVTSATAEVVVNPLTVGGSVSAGSATVCGGSNTGTITLTGHVGSVVEWQESVNFGPFTTVAPLNTTTTLNYSGLNDTTQYRVLVKSGECAQEISDTALIQIIPAAVGGQVTGALATNLCVDDTNTRTLTLTGSSGTILQWESSPTGAVWTGIGNAGSTTLNYQASVLGATTHFRVQLQDGACPAVFSTPDTVTIDQLSNAGTVNGAAAHCDTGNTGFVFITGFLGQVVTWQESNDGIAFTNVPASANDTLFYNNLLDTTFYRAIVQNGACSNDTSAAVTIIVSPDVVAGTLSGGASYCVTTNNTLLQLTGYTGSVTKWQESVNGGPFTDVAVTTDTLRRINVTQDTRYRVILSSGTCGADTSNLDSIVVGATVSGTISSSATFCGSTNGDTLLLTGNSGAVVKWQESTDGVVFTDVVPANTTDTLIYSNLADTTFYRAIVEGAGVCPDDTTAAVVINVDPIAIGGLLSENISFCDTMNRDTLILTGFQGSIVNWETSIDTGKTWVPFAPPFTRDTLIFTDVKVSTQYRVVVTSNNSCPDSLSNAVTVFIGPTQAGTITGSDTVCSTVGIDTLWLTNNIGDSILWQSSIDSLSWNFTGFDSTFQTTSGISATTFYRVIVVNDTCGSDTSAGFRVDVDQQTVAGTITGLDRICFSDTSLQTLTLNGTIGNILTWESIDTGSVWVDLTNMTNMQTYKNLEFNTTYRAIAQNGVCPNDTASITVFIDTTSMAGSLSGADTVCLGANGGTVFTVGSVGMTYSWESSTDNGSNWVPETSTDTFLNYTNLSDTTLFRVIVQNGGCPADTSDTVAVLIKPVAVGGTIQSDTAFCEGPNGGTLTLTGHVGNVLDWESSTDGTLFITQGNTTTTLNYVNLSLTTFYRAIVGLGTCPNDTSDTVTVTILPRPVVDITASGPLSFCEGDSVTLTATGGPTYRWNTGSLNESITVNVSDTFRVIVTDTSNSSNCQTVDSVIVEVFPLPVVDAGPNDTITIGTSAQLQGSGALIYSWSPTADLSNPTIADPDASPAQTTIYILLGEDANGCTGTDSMTLTVNTDLTPEFINLFTPDGDGINDTWQIGNLAGCTTCQLNIFNRYGQEVFSASDYQNDWEGTFDGKDLPDGTYYFVLKSVDTGKTYKGAVTILRGK